MAMNGTRMTQIAVLRSTSSSSGSVNICDVVVEPRRSPRRSSPRNDWMMVRIAGYIRPNASSSDRRADEQHTLELLTGSALEQGREEEHQAEDDREEGDREEHQEELASNALGAQERLRDLPGNLDEDVRRHGLTSGGVEKGRTGVGRRASAPPRFG